MRYSSAEDIKELRKIGDNLDDGLFVQTTVEKLKELWNWQSCVIYNKKGDIYNKKGDKWSLEIHTGGWSGHEEIIDELQCTMFWFFYWQKSERGGHYYFKGGFNKIAKGATNA